MVLLMINFISIALIWAIIVKYKRKESRYINLNHIYKGRIKNLENMLSNRNVVVESLDKENNVLQNQIRLLKEQNTELRSGIYTGFPNSNI